MNIITLDFETYYSQTYSLSKLTTEEYVRGGEFEVIGVAVKVNDGETTWCSGTYETIKEFLDGYSFEDNLALAHNAMFDAAILTWHFDISPRGWLDTLSMARAIHSTEVGGSLDKLTQFYGLGQKGDEVVRALGKFRLDFSREDLALYGEYCCNDVELTYKLFQCMSPEFPASELRLIDLTIRMYSEPTLEFEPELLQAHLRAQQEMKAHLLTAVGMDTRDGLMSNEKFADLLKQLKVVPPRKISPTTGKETWAFSKTDEAFKELASHENALVQALVAARLGLKSTQEETRTQRFIDIHTRGKLPIPLRYYAAHTGRWGGDDKINLQNLRRGSLLKKAILAPDGYMMVDSDSSQIEARTVAWLAGQDDLVEAFENGKDVYKIMASAIYGKEESEITKDERFVGKTTILGAGYGMGAVKFQTQLKTFGVSVEADEAARIIQVYRETYPEIPKLWKQAARALDAISDNKTCDLGRKGVVVVDGKKGIRMPNGLYIKYPNLRKRTNDDKDEYVYDTKRGRAVIPNKIYGGKVVENLCQGLARTIIGEQMLMIAKKYRVVMTVHDAIAIIAPENEILNAQEYVELCMRIRPSWAQELPLNCESGVGKSYGEC
jgi:DNA polymerase I-like protein with 3'-5' exonuclease and polymerase domains